MILALSKYCSFKWFYFYFLRFYFYLFFKKKYILYSIEKLSIWVSPAKVYSSSIWKMQKSGLQK